MTSNVEKLYKLIADDSRKKQSLFLIALNNPKSALEKICEIGRELDIYVTKEEVIKYLETQTVLIFFSFYQLLIFEKNQVFLNFS